MPKQENPAPCVLRRGATAHALAGGLVLEREDQKNLRLLYGRGQLT
jgi:hypothetical protein